MAKPVVIIGMGEMAGVFARAFLRNSTAVHPVTRQTDIAQTAEQLPWPELVLVAVGEKDLQETLTNLPDCWRRNTVLLQNELLPRDWEPHQLEELTVISVWFEKKKGMDFKVLIPSPVYGPMADFLQESLASIGIPCKILDSDEQLLHELVLKNVYIVTTNVAGLVTGGTVSELWKKHEALTRVIANEVMDIQEWLTGKQLDREQMISDMLLAFDGDPEHNCMGRSAPTRLKRALEIADEAGLAVPEMRKIAKQA